MVKRIRLDDPDDELESGSDAEYEVGYKKPPKKHQFKPGQSGNPKGRKKQSLNRKTILLEALKEEVTVKIGGKTRRMSKAALAFNRFIQKTIETGDVRAIQKLEEFMQAYGIGDEPIKEVHKTSQVVFFIPHNGRGPVGGPILKEKPGRPVSEWEVDDSYDPATGQKKIT